VLGIGGLLHRKVQHLSNGEMRKVLLARALARKPELLILDNPYAGLDHGSCAWLHRLVEQLMAEGMHIMVVAQQLEDIPRRTTHMLYIEGGRILAAGPKGALLAWGVGKRLSGGHRRISPVNSIRRRRKTPALPGGPPLVEIRDANVLYGRTSILKDVSWTVHAGESWALLGPNGSGKSTLISLVLGDNPQCYANHVVLFGKRRGTGESVWEVKQRIGWMAPELQFSYESDVTCFEVVCSGFFDSIGLYRMCGQEKRRAVRSWLKDLGLMPLAATPFGRLSDGQQRMVLLARAMVKTPPLLILDEPCQGLDPANRQAVVAVVDAVVRATGSTLIYVAHRQDEIPSCVNHEIRLREGRVTRRRRLRREL
jgi:molybdate transport system ATP-binding protein